MKSSGRNIKLTSYDDLFSTEESRADAQREKVMEIPLSELHPFRNHPFKVLDDEKMQLGQRNFHDLFALGICPAFLSGEEVIV